MTSEADRIRVDVWLWRARFAKTRAVATDLISAGGVRLMRDGQTRRLEKSSATVIAGDVLVFSQPNGLRTVEVLALGARRGPPAEARTLYRDLGAHLHVEPDPLA
ncbi:ribosome-associated heat shock protein [alpha proteobacterium U9-1i]|nr:ribosome-associated heat shock protein [alpha proteobacterium U9-1i]